MKFYFFLFVTFICSENKIVKSYDDLIKILERKKNSLIILDLVDTFFFNTNEDFCYENLQDTKKKLRKNHQKRADFDQKIYKNDQKIHDFKVFLRQKHLHLLAISNQKFFTNIKFQNMLLNDKNYINNVLFYTNHSKKNSLSNSIKYLVRQYDEIIIITRCPEKFHSIEASFDKPILIVLYIPAKS